MTEGAPGRSIVRLAPVYCQLSAGTSPLVRLTAQLADDIMDILADTILWAERLRPPPLGVRTGPVAANHVRLFWETPPRMTEGLLYQLARAQLSIDGPGAQQGGEERRSFEAGSETATWQRRVKR